MAEKYYLEYIVYVPEGECFLEWITQPFVKRFFRKWKSNEDLNELNSFSKIYAEYNPGIGLEELLDKARIKKFKDNTELYYVCAEIESIPQNIEWRRIEDNYFPEWFKKTSIFNNFF